MLPSSEGFLFYDVIRNFMTEKKHTAYLAAEKIKSLAPQFKPLIGIVLGSGLGSFAETLTDAITINYQDLPGFPSPHVFGHAGKMVLGNLDGVDIVCLQGRAHSYEGNNHDTVKTYVRTLKLLGCEYFLATNASGSMRPDIEPGELMLITDHINLQPGNPLIGENDDDFGPRFFPLDNAYDADLRQKLMHIAEQQNTPLHEGIYLSVVGPNYETAAEIRAFQKLGADAVGMSTVPEVLVACHCGLKVAVIAIITNFATGLDNTSHCHNAVVKQASEAAVRLNKLLKQFVVELR